MGAEEGRTSGSERKRRKRALGEREREIADDLGEEEKASDKKPERKV